MTNLSGFANPVLADRGFRVAWNGSATEANQDTYVQVSWAYTAP